MQRIVVLNPKGGSGKTTLAINLAAYFAARGDNTLLIDRDPQGSSTRWLRKRKVPQPAINGIATFERDSRTTMSWQMRVPEGTQKIMVDSPAAVEARGMPELTRDAHKVIVPVLPSDIDIHAASRCIADLLLVAKIKPRGKPHRRDRQPGAQEHADVPVADALPREARHPHRRDRCATRRTTCEPPNRASASTK